MQWINYENWRVFFLRLKIVIASLHTLVLKKWYEWTDWEKKRKERTEWAALKCLKKSVDERKGWVGGGWRVLGRLGSVGPSNDTAKSVLQSSRWQCHHSWCVNIGLCGLVHFGVFLPHAHKTEWETALKWVFCAPVWVCMCDGRIILSCACVCMCQCVCACVRAWL